MAYNENHPMLAPTSTTTPFSFSFNKEEKGSEEEEEELLLLSSAKRTARMRVVKEGLQHCPFSTTLHRNLSSSLGASDTQNDGCVVVVTRYLLLSASSITFLTDFSTRFRFLIPVAFGVVVVVFVCLLRC